MKASPISLMDYCVTDLSFTANREFAVERAVDFRREDFSATPAVQHSPLEQEPRRWQVTLEVKHTPATGCNFPYAYRLVLVGFFRAEQSVAPEQEERTVRIHGSSVLYGMGREIVRAITGRGPYRPVLIPTASFYDPPSVASSKA